MNKEREPQLIVATGKKGVGKTYTTKQLIARYTKVNTKTGKPPRRVLIYDVNMEYTQYKAISPHDLKKFSAHPTIETRRVLPKNDDGSIADIDQMIDILHIILADFRGGLLILEDINRYLTDTRSKEVIGLLATNRHRDLDIIIHLQSLAPMTTRMWQNCNVIRFHRQSDEIDRYEQRVTNFELYKIAQILVNQQYASGNQRFYCYVSSDDDDIKGKYAIRSFKEACVRYCSEYPSKVNRYKKRYDGKDAYQKAVDECVGELMKYNGNGK